MNMDIRPPTPIDSDEDIEEIESLLLLRGDSPDVSDTLMQTSCQIENLDDDPTPSTVATDTLPEIPCTIEIAEDEPMPSTVATDTVPQIPSTIEIAEDECMPLTVAPDTVPPSTSIIEISDDEPMCLTVPRSPTPRALPDPPEDQVQRDLSPLTALGSSDPPDDAYACAPGTPEPYQTPNIDPPSSGASDGANADVIDIPRSSQDSPSRLTIRIPPRVPVEHDYTTIAGCPFLPQTPSVVWPGGTVKTNLPWLPHPDNPEENLMAKDEKHVRGLAETGRPASESDWISIVRYEDYADEFELGEHIRDEIAQSHAVVVRGCPYRPIPLDAQQIWKGMRIPPGQTLNVHDGAKRVEDVAMPFKFMTLEDFCEGQRDPNKIQCVLHCPTVDGSRPELIR
ncbi:hypothetical protein BYT27DRAFT_7252714 [Phlegmacium glaucopus]|nr:hypothetical protein BYT27DRAFT_7252714 [Phlegmacium glaucopus]